MSEKLAEVYEQYDMEILSTRKGRGATILTTTDGLRILEPFRGSVTRLEQEYVLKQLFLKEGCTNLDMLLPNREGQLLTCDKYRQPFVMKCHFEGNECDMCNLEDVLRTVEALADFHMEGRKVAKKFAGEWEKCRQEKEQKKIEEIRKAIAGGEELERISYIYEISQSALESALHGTDEREPLQEPSRRQVQETEETNRESDKPFIPGNVLETTVQKRVSEDREEAEHVRMKDIFLRHNREMKKIQKYVATVKRKNEFETTFQRVVPEYIRKGMECVDRLEQMVNGENGISLHPVLEHHYGICHGSYNHHNVILGEQSVAIVHFERFSKGNQLEDLYQFARKAMEKNQFDYVLLEDILRTYHKKIALSREDYYYLYILFAYPEKFWKIANSYYNSNKAFLSPKYLEKLQTVILQEQEKQEMLAKYWGFHSL